MKCREETLTLAAVAASMLVAHYLIDGCMLFGDVKQNTDGLLWRIPAQTNNKENAHMQAPIPTHTRSDTYN
jgi:hypothetical protein